MDRPPHRIHRCATDQLVSAEPEQTFRRRVPLDDDAVDVVQHKAFHQGVEDRRLELFALVELVEHHLAALSGELLLDQRGQVGEDLTLGVIELAGLAVDDAEGAHRHAVRTVHDVPGVEADVGVAGDQRVLGEPIIGTGIGHDHRVGGLIDDRVGAERDVPRRLRRGEPELRLEPLAILIDQAHQRDGHVEHGRGEPDDPVEPLLRVRVEQPDGVQRLQSAGLVSMLRSRTHWTTRLPGTPTRCARTPAWQGAQPTGPAAALGTSRRIGSGAGGNPRLSWP